MKNVVQVGALALLTACGSRGAPELVPGAQHEVLHRGAAHAVHVSAPALAVGRDGAIHLAWLESGDSGRHVLALRIGDANAEPQRVNPSEQVPAGHDAPGLAIGPAGEVHVSWSARRSGGGPFDSDLLLSTSRDGGAHFEPPLVVSGEARGARGFDDLAAAPDGTLFVAWIEGGARAETRVARVGDAGRRVDEISRLGEGTCPCCRVDVATGPAGDVGVLWRAELPGAVRDMRIARSGEGGFEAAQPVHDDGWSLEGCPHRGGSLGLDAAGNARVTWYTEGEHARPELRIARAAAAGAFEAPTRVHELRDSLPDRVALALRPDGEGVVVWETTTPVRSGIAARRIHASGLGAVRGLSSAMQASGPAVAVLPDGAIAVAWNEEAFPDVRTRVQRFELPAAR